MGWQTSTALVKSKQKNGEHGYGTGFAVRPGWLLTAAHVLKTDRDELDVIVRWQHSSEEGYREADKNGGFLNVEKCIFHPTLDAALVKCPMPSDIDRVSIAREKHAAGEFDSEGYPQGANAHKPTHVRVSGDAQTEDGSEAKFQVTMDQNPENVTDWKGLSGGALVLRSSGQAIGLFKETREILSEGRAAWAVPIYRLLEDETFRRILIGDPDAASISEEDVATVRRQIRSLIITALQGLEMDDQVAIFEKAGEDSSKFSGNQCDKICDWFLGLGSDHAWKHIRSVQKGLGEDLVDRRNDLTNLSALLAVYALEDDVFKQVALLKRDSKAPDGFVISATAHTMVGIELSASAVDGMIPQYEPGRDEGTMPYGSYAMPFVTPEAGPSETDGAAHFLERLHQETGLSAVPSDQLTPAVEGYLSNDQKLKSGAPLVPGDELDERAVRRLRNLLDRRRDDEERSYYLTVVWPEDEELKNKLRGQLEEIRRRYPAVLVLSLGTDDDEFDREEQRLGRLITTIKDRQRDQNV